MILGSIVGCVAYAEPLFLKEEPVWRVYTIRNGGAPRVTATSGVGTKFNKVV
jgi:hypothetical protein